MSTMKTGTWVLVADGEKAIFLENHGDDKFPDLRLRRKEQQDNPPTREQAANRPGRDSDGPSGHYSAFEDTDWHELAKDRFAVDLADMLYKRAHKGMFDQLVVIASPSVLGVLRDHFHKEVASRIIAEVPKTLTNHPVNEIEEQATKAVKDAS